VLIRVAADSYWEAAPRLPAAEFFAPFDVRDVAHLSQTKDMRPKGRVAVVAQDPAVAEVWGIEPARCNPRELVTALDALRTRKSPYEVECMAAANRKAARGHLAVRDAWLAEAGTTAGAASELELHLLYLRATGQDDADTPYKNIVALGAHAATLHHVTYEREPRAADSLLVDAGAQRRGYHSDITRTWTRGQGAAAELFAELVARLDELQQTMCARVRPGVPYEQLHNQAHELLAVILCDLGLARGSADELVDQGVTRKLLPHGLGHSLGVQTHDVGCRAQDPEPRNPYLRTTITTAPGHVFTVEPGCYFIDSLLGALRAEPAGNLLDWKLVDALRPFGGIRIEDNVLVTDGAPRNLTREAFAAAR